jgi:hypothetical protein
MLKKYDPHVFKLDVVVNCGNPEMIEETTELKSQYGEADGVVACRMFWNYKLFDMFNENRLILEGEVGQQFTFKKLENVTITEAKGIVANCYVECSRLLKIHLLANGIDHDPKALPKDQLERFSDQFVFDLKTRLF